MKTKITPTISDATASRALTTSYALACHLLRARVPDAPQPSQRRSVRERGAWVLMDDQGTVLCTVSDTGHLSLHVSGSCVEDLGPVLPSQAHVFMWAHTIWQCANPVCRHMYSKRGRHLLAVKQCRNCGERVFLTDVLPAASDAAPGEPSILTLDDLRLVVALAAREQMIEYAP